VEKKNRGREKEHHLVEEEERRRQGTDKAEGVDEDWDGAASERRKEGDASDKRTEEKEVRR
jgi:hypothetical protein